MNQALWLLLALCAAPIVLRPLTTPGASLQQRYVVVALILGAVLMWFGWCEFDDWTFHGPPAR
jgi:ammonia channel protein AmtB